MANLSRKDVNALFMLLALLFLLDSIRSGFLLPLGIIVFAVMILLVVQSDRLPDLKFLDNSQVKNVEWFARIGVFAVFLGVLIQSALVIAFGFLFAMLMLLTPVQTLDIDLWTIGVTAKATKKKAKK